MLIWSIKWTKTKGREMWREIVIFWGERPTKTAKTWCVSFQAKKDFKMPINKEQQKKQHIVDVKGKHSGTDVFSRQLAVFYCNKFATKDMRYSTNINLHHFHHSQLLLSACQPYTFYFPQSDFYSRILHEHTGLCEWWKTALRQSFSALFSLVQHEPGFSKWCHVPPYANQTLATF